MLRKRRHRTSSLSTVQVLVCANSSDHGVVTRCHTLPPRRHAPRRATGSGTMAPMHQPQGAAFDVVLILHVGCVVVGIATTVTAATTAGRLRHALGSAGPLPDTLRRYFRPGINWAGRTIYGIPAFGFALVAMSQGTYASPTLGSSAVSSLSSRWHSCPRSFSGRLNGGSKWPWPRAPRPTRPSRAPSSWRGRVALPSSSCWPGPCS